MPKFHEVLRATETEVVKMPANLDKVLVTRSMAGFFPAAMITGDLYGLEFEFEGPGVVGHGTRTWQEVKDGSLRNNGTEYVLSGAMSPAASRNAIVALFNKIGEEAMQDSHRCSTHVHVNAGDMTLDQVTNVIVLYSALEPFLMRWAGPDRVNNHFCLTMDQSLVNVHDWHRYLDSGDFDPSDGAKYCALNIASLGRHGTLEFRLGRGYTNADEAIYWFEAIRGLVAYARSFKNPLHISALISAEGPRGLCEEVANRTEFPDQVFERLYENANFDRYAAVLEGFRRTQKLVGNFPWGSWCDMINAKVKEPEPRGDTIPRPADLEEWGLEENQPQLRNVRWDVFHGEEPGMIRNPRQRAVRNDF